MIRKLTLLVAVMLGTSLLGHAQVVKPSLAIFSNEPGVMHCHLTAGSEAFNGFTVYWNLDNLPLDHCNFITTGGSQCMAYSLQPGQSADFDIDPTQGNSVCQIYPDNEDGLICNMTYRFFVRIPSGRTSNNAYQQNICP